MVGRLAGWEGRFNAVIEAARAKPYVLGEHDCFRLACAVVEALTGIDRWPEFAGHYSTKREALARIREHGGNFEDAASWFFGGEPIGVNFARRGDIVAYRADDGEFHLGVITGKHFVVMADAGLIELPRAAARSAWRVG